MKRLGSLPTAPAGISIELSSHGKKVVLRAWSPYDSIPAIHISIEEFAREFGLAIPPRKKVEKPRHFPAAKRVARAVEAGRQRDQIRALDERKGAAR